VLLAVAIPLLYVQCFRPGASLDSPSSTDRSASLGPELWAMANVDPGAMRVTAATTPLDAATAWSRQLDAPVVAPIVTDGQAIYVALKDGRLLALSVEDGSDLWTAPVPGRLNAAPTVAGDALYLGLRGGRVSALDRATGETRWLATVGESTSNAPAVVDGVVWVNGGRKIFALDTETGRELWSRGLRPDLAFGSPLVGSDHVILRTKNRVLFFDSGSGSKSFSARVRDAAHVSVGHGIVVAVTPQLTVTFDADSSLPWWDHGRNALAWLHLLGILPELPVPPHRWSQNMVCEPRAPVIQPHQVVLACGDGTVRAHDLLSGDLLWEASGAPIVGSPVLTASGLLMAEREALVLLDPESGAELDRRPLDEVELREFFVTASGIYLLTQSDRLVALR